MNAHINNQTIINADTQRINAIQKYLVSLPVEIPLNGVLLKPSEVIALFQKSIDVQSAVTAKQAAYKAAIAERKTVTAARKGADAGLKAWILNRFGADSPEALAFGYAPRKKPTVAAATRAEAVLLNKATRKARMTMGKKQKLVIKGSLVDPTAPAAPATHVAPPVVPPAAQPPASPPAPVPVVVTGNGAAANGVAHA